MTERPLANSTQPKAMPYTLRYCFVQMEARHEDGRLAHGMYGVAGRIWHIGPGGEEW